MESNTTSDKKPSTQSKNSSDVDFAAMPLHSLLDLDTSEMSEEQLRNYVTQLRQYRTQAPTLSRKIDEDVGRAKPKKTSVSKAEKRAAVIDDLLS